MIRDDYVTKKEHSETADLCQSESIWIWSPDLDSRSRRVPKLVGTSLSKEDVNLHEDPISIPERSKIAENALSRNLKIVFKKFLDPHPDAEDFRTKAVFLVQRHLW